MPMSNKGIVLISVLLIVLMLSAISVSIGKYYFLSFQREGYVDFQSNAIQYIGNIEILALKEVTRELRLSKKYMAKDNILLNNPFGIEIENGLVSAKLSDASDCFNVNSLYDHKDQKYLINTKAVEGFKRLLRILEYEDNVIDSLTDQVLDWIDSDNEPRSNGLEDYYYIGPMHTTKQFTAKRFFYHLSEIRSLPASKNINWQVFQEHFCVYPNLGDYKININLLQLNNSILLASIIPDLTIDQAEVLISEIPLEGFKSISELYTAFPNINFNQSYLPISLTTELLLLRSDLSSNEYSASATAIINFKNNKATILSRFYNGI